MKILSLVRHAKSCWKDLSLADYERPLNKRGQRDAPRMGKRMAKRDARPEHILSSPAVRALTTAKVIAAELGYKSTDVIVNEEIYGAGAGELFEMIRNLDSRFDQIMLVGHNPALTDLVNLLAGSDIVNVPTCGVVVLGFQTDSWMNIGIGTGELLEFDYPKRSK